MGLESLAHRLTPLYLEINPGDEMSNLAVQEVRTNVKFFPRSLFRRDHIFLASYQLKYIHTELGQQVSSIYWITIVSQSVWVIADSSSSICHYPTLHHPKKLSTRSRFGKTDNIFFATFWGSSYSDKAFVTAPSILTTFSSSNLLPTSCKATAPPWLSSGS